MVKKTTTDPRFVERMDKIADNLADDLLANNDNGEKIPFGVRASAFKTIYSYYIARNKLDGAPPPETETDTGDFGGYAKKLATLRDDNRARTNGSLPAAKDG